MTPGRFSLYFSLLCLALLLSGSLQAEEEKKAALSAGVLASELTDHVKVLASDEFEGRRAGTAGAEKAAAYIAGQFEAIGLKPIGEDGTYYQHFNLPGGQPDLDMSSLVVLAKENRKPFQIDLHWSAFSFSSPGRIEGAEVVFAGYGIHAPDLGYDDYADIDVKGKVVLVLRHAPREGKPAYSFGGGRSQQRHLSFVGKAAAAQRAGAAAMILFQDLGHHPERADGLVSASSMGGGRAGVPALMAKRKVAAAILAGSGKDLEALEGEIDETGKPKSFGVPGVTLDLVLAMKSRRTANVVGLLEGSDPELKKQLVVVGAHYDHLGVDGMGALDPRARGKIRNGADDNASGTAGVLELAEYFALSPQVPKRSILFITFTGEELGLLGSQHYVQNPLIPLERTAAMMNMDMIGRSKGGDLFIGGIGTSPVFGPILDKALEGGTLKVRRGEGGAAPSDNMSFFMKGVPALFFFTGMHRDYHRATDDWDKIEYESQLEIVNVVADITRAVADLDEKPKFINAGGGGIGGRRGPYMGVMPDLAAGGRGATIQRVMPGTPAARAGLEDGDRIVKFGADEIEGWGGLRQAIAKHKAGDEVKLVILRGEKEKELSIKLGGR